MSDLDRWLEISRDCKYLPENDLKQLCDLVCDLLLEESNIQPVSTPVTVCGDIHGQVGAHEIHHTKYASGLMASHTSTNKSEKKEENYNSHPNRCFDITKLNRNWFERLEPIRMVKAIDDWQMPEK